MAKFIIECDEQNNISYKKNGSPVNKSSKLALNTNGSFGDLIKPKGNWNGLLNEIIDYCDDDTIEICFRGKPEDSNVLNEAITDHNRNSAEVEIAFRFDKVWEEDADSKATQQSEIEKEIIPAQEIVPDDVGIRREIKYEMPTKRDKVNKKRRKEKKKRRLPMTKFSIDYNPYLLESKFMKNGKEVAGSSSLGTKAKVRLQILLGEQTNWEGLFEEIRKECDDNNIEISFRGRRLDYEDLQFGVETYLREHKDVSIELLPCEEVYDDSKVQESLDEIINDIKKKIAKQKEIGKVSEIISKLEKTNEDGKDIFDLYEEAKDGILSVSVIATMSSGKSTLINSLLNTELLPSENEACTATITSITDYDEMKDFKVIFRSKDGKEVHPKKKEKLVDMLKEYNKDPEVTYMDICGNIPAIKSDKIRLRLLDTPGPNNSKDKNHKELTYSIIEDKNMIVLYVMNFTQQKTNDDRQLLEKISNEMKKKGKLSSDRFIFVVNKWDEIDAEKEKNPVESIKEYLKGFGIIDPILIPASARLALLIRKKRNRDKLTLTENAYLSGKSPLFGQMKELHLENFATTTPKIIEDLRKKVDSYRESEDEENEILIHSGVPVIEHIIADYIDKYAFPIKINDSVKAIISILDEIDMQSKFNDLIVHDSEKLEKVQEQIREATYKYDNSKGIYEEYKNRIGAFEIVNREEMETKSRREQEYKAQQAVKEYIGEEKIDKAEASIIKDKIIIDMQDIVRRTIEALSAKIEQEIFRTGVEMLESYQSLVRKILGEIKIDGYQFERLSSIQTVNISDIDDMFRKAQTDRMEKYTYEVERAAYRNAFFLFKPFIRRYDVKEGYRKVGTDVNIKEFSDDVLDFYLNNGKENIESAFEQADRQVEEYKRIFNKNLDELDEKIQEELNKLEKDTQDEFALKNKVEENKELAEWAEGIEKRIRNVLSGGGV